MERERKKWSFLNSGQLTPLKDLPKLDDIIAFEAKREDDRIDTMVVRVNAVAQYQEEDKNILFIEISSIYFTCLKAESLEGPWKVEYRNSGNFFPVTRGPFLIEPSK